MAKRVILSTTYIAGMKHYVPEEFSDKFLAGDRIQLRPELTNEYDAFAVEVLWEVLNEGFQKVGYVPRFLSKEISTHIAAGRNIKAEITEDAKAKMVIFEEKEA